MVCIGPTTNNIAKYQAVIGLLTEAASQDIYDLVVFMDSQLVHLLERSFECITYRHVPRSENTVANSLANYILDWHIVHS